MSKEKEEKKINPKFQTKTISVTLRISGNKLPTHHTHDELLQQSTQILSIWTLDQDNYFRPYTLQQLQN
jgi:hypothetical protein